ncbi:MAG: phytoene/squalene synthase family protein [Candidatus Dojkabacteria bacterium]
MDSNSKIKAKEGNINNSIARDTFKKASTTYFFSSLFFPKNIRQDVTTLYAFVRKADNFVDRVPQDLEGIKTLIAQFYSESEDPIINNFKALEKKLEFDPAWTEAFFNAMLADTTDVKYQTIDDLLRYIYGSAEVIGLYMCRILALPMEADQYALLQGRAMQLINFIRDIAEDLSLSRQYIPANDLKKYGLASLEYDATIKNREGFNELINFELARYFKWQKEAAKGYKLIPKQYRNAIKTASDMYNWTAKQIAKDPFIIYSQKVKPSKLYVLSTGIKNSLF